MKTLIKKLAAAKKEIGTISKDSKNPFFKSKYFDINQLLHHVEPILEKHGLMILQPIESDKVTTAIVEVDTTEEVTSTIILPPMTDPQKLGSCITYYRRYTLASLLALQAEDDDANKTKPTPKKKEKETLNPVRFEAALQSIRDGKTTADYIKKNFKLTAEQIKLLTK